MKKMNKNAIILLSGGLDSLVSTAIASKKYNIKLALFFNYNQNAYKKELEAFKKICKHYKIKGQIINAKWLGEISQSFLNNSSKTTTDATKYWVPNRNGLFVNIGASYAEAMNCNTIIIGANITEAEDFPDNSKHFIKSANQQFKYSTKNGVKIQAPLIELNKKEIMQKAIELDAPLDLIWSCYYDGDKHCGKCPSCKLLLNALDECGQKNLKKLLF